MNRFSIKAAALLLVGVMGAAPVQAASGAQKCTQLSAPVQDELQRRAVLIRFYIRVMPGYENIMQLPGHQTGFTPRYGSGVLLNGTQVLTAAHVVLRLDQKLWVEASNRCILGTVAAYDEKGGHDLALIQLGEAVEESAQALQVSPVSPGRGSAVWLWSNRQGGVLRQAAVGDDFQPFTTEKVLTGVTNVGIPGDSGSALVNCSGQVVGIVSSWRIPEKYLRSDNMLLAGNSIFHQAMDLAAAVPQNPEAYPELVKLGMRNGLVKPEAIGKFLATYAR